MRNPAKCITLMSGGTQSGLIIGKALQDAGASLKDVVRARYIIVNPADWEKVAPVFGQYFGDVRPASTAIICGLVDARMKIEIEVTAKRQ